MMGKKVVLGLSGGVDSAVALVRLMEQGYDVTPVFMRNWDSLTNNDILGNSTINNEICPQEEDYMDAKRVCDKLGIELKRIDFIAEYWDYVFSYFLAEYKKGRTPNPDIMCNKEIKFKAFLEYAKTLDCDYIAMGHYARVERKDGRAYMLRGVDSNKDQTYFLSQINQAQLNSALFPVGDLVKTEVRAIAKKYDLPVANKKDSTGICFIGERNFHQFLKNYLPAKPGNMVTLDGKVVAQHDGLMYYTIGQRKGLNIGGLKEYANEPWFVLGKDLEKNELIIGQGINHPYLFSDKAIVSNLNWFNERPEENKVYQAKFRYREKDNEVMVKFLSEDLMEVICLKPVRAITPGQACVIYDNEYCLGGGTIDEAYFKGEKRKY